MVLTQTCDLVRGRATAHAPCKSDYITICPVRPLERILLRAMKNYVREAPGGLPIGTEKDRVKFTDFLERLFNNNEQGLFYLEQSDSALGVDCCAITRLSIGLKSGLHYEKCLNSRILQLSEVFEAKLGWSVGNIYSRVGTRDWGRKELSNKVRAALSDQVIWVKNEREQKFLLERLSTREQTEQGQPIAARDVKAILNQMGDARQSVADSVERVMNDVQIDARKVAEVKRRLLTDSRLANLLNT